MEIYLKFDENKAIMGKSRGSKKKSSAKKNQALIFLRFSTAFSSRICRCLFATENGERIIPLCRSPFQRSRRYPR